MIKLESTLHSLEAAFGAAMAEVRAEATRMDAAAHAATGGRILPVVRCQVPTRIAQGYRIEGFVIGNRWGYPTWSDHAAAARTELSQALAQLEATHSENLPALENNRQVSAQVKLIMGNLGIPETTSTFGYPTPSARKMKRTVKRAGYLADLEAVCIEDDGYEGCKQALDRFAKCIEEYEQKQRALEVQQEHEKAAKEREKSKLKMLGAIAAKYDCYEDSEVADVLPVLFGRDKYLMLGHYLVANRNNWNDGPALARLGLHQFSVETPEDDAIVGELRSAVDNWQGDGRVFRDCEYGYDYLFKKANQEVYHDYCRLMEADEG